jgi:hypothetical protein
MPKIAVRWNYTESSNPGRVSITPKICKIVELNTENFLYGLMMKYAWSRISGPVTQIFCMTKNAYSRISGKCPKLLCDGSTPNPTIPEGGPRSLSICTIVELNTENFLYGLMKK